MNSKIYRLKLKKIMRDMKKKWQNGMKKGSTPMQMEH